MDSSASKHIGLDELHERVRTLGQGPKDINADIADLVADLEHTHLHVAPEHDLVALQQGIREKIDRLGIHLDYENNQPLQDLDALLTLKLHDAQPTAPAPSAAATTAIPSAIPSPTSTPIPTPTAPSSSATTATAATAAASAAPVAAAATVAGTPSAPTAAPSVAPGTRDAEVDQFLTRMLESGSDRMHAVTHIIERKLIANTGIDLDHLARFIGTPSLRLSPEASAIVNRQGVNSYIVEGELTVKQRALQDAKEEMEDARSLTGNAAAAATAKQIAMTEARTKIRDLGHEVHALEEALTYMSRNQTYKPRQLLMMVNYFLNQNDTKTNIARQTDQEITREVSRVDTANWRNNGALGILRPTLKETLRDLYKVPELESLKEGELEKLVDLKTEVAVKKWIEKLEGGEANYSSTVPALIAYLQAAMADKTGTTRINTLSWKSFEQLVNNLKGARNGYFASKVEKESAGATNQEKMLKYLAMLNQADETKVEVDQHILSDIMTKSYLKAGVKVAALPIAAASLSALMSLGPISTVLGWFGASNVGGMGVIAGLAKGIGLKTVGAGILAAGVHAKQEHIPANARTIAKSASLRLLGLSVMGPLGLLAPEIFHGGKFLFRHRETIKKGAGVAGTIAKGTSTVIAAPFKGAAKVVHAVRGKGPTLKAA